MRILVVGFLVFAPSMLTAAVCWGDNAAPQFAGDRIVISARLSQQPATFILDTGAAYTVIFQRTAERFQIETESSRETRIGGHTVLLGKSVPVELEMLGDRTRVQLPILPVASAHKFDGVFSWRNLTAALLLIDGYERKVRVLPKPPTTGWQRWPLDKDATQLFFTVTRDGKPLGRVFVDTGAVSGLRLSPSLWKAWREQNPEAGMTLEPFRYVVGETMVHELSWAEEYQLGDLTLRNIDIGPIPEAQRDRAVDAEGQEFIAILGIRALRQLRLLINRTDHEVLTQSVSLVPEHNRAGVVFVKRAERVPGFYGIVLAGSPAEKSGLRTGDRLLEIDSTEFRSTVADPVVDPAFFFSKPAGTELRVKIERDGAVHDFLVKLQDLLPRSVSRKTEQP